MLGGRRRGPSAPGTRWSRHQLPSRPRPPGGPRPRAPLPAPSREPGSKGGRQLRSSCAQGRTRAARGEEAAARAWGPELPPPPPPPPSSKPPGPGAEPLRGSPAPGAPLAPLPGTSTPGSPSGSSASASGPPPSPPAARPTAPSRLPPRSRRSGQRLPMVRVHPRHRSPPHRRTRVPGLTPPAPATPCSGPPHLGRLRQRWTQETPGSSTPALLDPPLRLTPLVSRQNGARGRALTSRPFPSPFPFLHSLPARWRDGPSASQWPRAGRKRCPIAGRDPRI